MISGRGRALVGTPAPAGCLGAAIGILLGTGAFHDARTYLALRSAHMAINVLGWVSLTIVGTLITLLPTVLRVRMPASHGKLTAGLFVTGVA